MPESLSRAASFYRLALLTLLSREDRRTVHYQVDGAEVTVTVERPRDGIGFEPVAAGILCCWAAGEFDTAAAIGSLPTQLYRPEGKRTPQEALMFWTFSLASVARGNLQAFARAAEHLRESAGTAGPEVRTWAAGFALPGTAALEAALAGKQRVAARHLVKMLRYHRWRTRDGGLSSGLDIGTSGLVCFARSRGVLLEIADPLLAEPGERNLHPTTS